MITVRYEECGRSISDFQIQQEIEELIKAEGDVTVSVSSSLFIFALRAAIATKKINDEDLIFMIGDEELMIDRHGRMVNQEVFCDPWETYLDDILSCGFGG